MKLSKLFFSAAIVATMTLATQQAKAQDSKILVGGGLSYATEISTLGIFAKGVYQITDEWEGSLGINYYLPKDMGFVKLTWIGIDLDAHYVFSKQDQMEFYGLAGLNIMRVSTPGYTATVGGSTITVPSASVNNSGLNLGAGGRYKFSDRLYGLGEVKYTIGDGGFLQFSAGVLYRL